MLEAFGLGFRLTSVDLKACIVRKTYKSQGLYSPLVLDRKWLWVYDKKIPICPLFYLLKGGL